jgi:IclR family transcriptional regulator, acetate operon repressor
MSDQNGTEVPRHHRVLAVVKAMQLLVRIGEAPGGLAVADAAREIGIPLTTAYHIVNTMLSEGFLTRDSSRRYTLGPKVATLAAAYERGGPPQALLAELRSLASATGETAYLSAWRDNQVIALATIEGSNAVRVGGAIHTELRGLEHARAAGKAMLACLPPDDLEAYLETHDLTKVTANTITDRAVLIRQVESIRKNGYAIEEAEFTEGVGCVAAPILQGRTCIGCFTISAPIDRFNRDRTVLVAAALEAANRHSAA